MAIITSVYVIFPILFTALVAQDCHQGWIQYKNSCYLFPNRMDTWAAAELQCRSLKGALVEIEDAAEEMFLENTIVTNGTDQDYWIGCTDLALETVWEWADSEQPLNYTHWHPGQPDNHRGENCAVLTHSRWRHEWNDVPCDRTYAYICERKLVEGPEVVIIG